MATPVLGNGMLLRDNIFPVTAHVDSYNLQNLMKSAKPTDMGIVEYFAQTQMVQPFLYNFSSFGGKNERIVDDPVGRYSWSVPVVNDMPHVTRDLDSTNTKKGLGGVPFQIALSRRAFGHTDIITYDKMAGLELYVMDYNVINTENGETIYTVRIVNYQNGLFLDNNILVPQTTFFRKTSARGEYGERFSDVNMRAGYREFYNYISNAEADCSFSVTKWAHDRMVAEKGGIPVKEIFQIRDNDLMDIARVNISAAEERIKQVGMLKMMNEGQISYSYVTALEAAAAKKCIEDIENYMMWGIGGTITTDGADDVRLSQGLWRQLDNSFQRVYNIGTWNMGILQSELFNYYNGRVDFVGPDPKREVIVQTGIAGMQQVNVAIQQMATNSGLVINASEVGAITNKGMDLKFGFAYTSYVIPFLANVKFVVNPALDPVEANDWENPYINGFRLSSYCYIIWDITESGGNDNIYMMKGAWDKGLTWYYVNGSCDYMGRNGHSAAGDFSGYKVRMMMYHKSVKVVDPTRVLKIVPLNPRTGRAFGS